MAFFSQFPKIDYNTLGDGIENRIIDIYRNVDVRDFKIDDLVTYTYYEIKDGERPDIVSRKLYKTDQYYWTFFITNDHLKEGLKGWPKSYNQLDEYIRNKYDDYGALVLKPKQDDGSYSFGSGYFSSIAGLDIYSDPNIHITFTEDSQKSYKPYLYDHDMYQLWFENKGDISFPTNTDSFKLVYLGTEAEKNNWIENIFKPWHITYINRGEELATYTNVFNTPFNIHKYIPIASEAPKDYIDPVTGDINCVYGVLIAERQGDPNSFKSYRQYEEEVNFNKTKIKIIRPQQVSAFADAYKKFINK